MLYFVSSNKIREIPTAGILLQWWIKGRDAPPLSNQMFLDFWENLIKSYRGPLEGWNPL